MKYLNIIIIIIILFLSVTKISAQYIEFGDVNFMPEDLLVEIPIVATSQYDMAGLQIGLSIYDNTSVSIKASTPELIAPIFQSYTNSEAAILWFEVNGESIDVQIGQILAYIEIEITPSSNGCFSLNSGIAQISNIIYLSNDGVLEEEEFDMDSKEFCSFDPLLVELSLVDNTCFNQINSSAALEISGGVTPYNIIWTNSLGVIVGTNITEISNLPNGNYQVVVLDAFQNEFVIDFEIKSPPPITFTPTFSDIICSNTFNGFINIETEQDLHYSWSDGTDNSNLENLPAGEYNVTITNSASCDSSFVFSIVNYKEPDLAYTTKNTCINHNNGEILFANLELDYQWSDNQVNGDRDSLHNGVYSVSITDENQCEFVVADISIDTFPRLIPEISTVQPICFGYPTGEIHVDSTNLISINWDSDDSIQFFQDSLTDGIYNFTYTDINQCRFDYSEVIIAPEELISTFSLDSATCYSCEDGGIFIDIQGGATPYELNIFDTISNTYNSEGLLPGSYQYNITDANGCTLDSFFTIDLLTLDISVFKPISVITPLSADNNSSLIFDGLENHPDNLLSIYNRWGNIVFKSINYQSLNKPLFDGMYRGNPLPEGKYFYRLEVKSFDKPLSNTLTIIR
jgi:gliding motility-associated-like protein